MNDPHPLRKAIAICGLLPLARALGVSYQAVRKWEAAGRMPRTEWTGETTYAAIVEQLTHFEVTREALLSAWPVTPEVPSSCSGSGCLAEEQRDAA